MKKCREPNQLIHPVFRIHFIRGLQCVGGVDNFSICKNGRVYKINKSSFIKIGVKNLN